MINYVITLSRVKYYLFAFSICVCLLLAFSTTLSASGTTFVLGSNTSGSYTPTGTGWTSSVSVGPYPGTLTINGTVSPNALFFCMTGNQTAASTENGVEAGPGTAEGTQTVQQQEEAAFLASLALSDAFADKISFGTSGSGTSKTVTLTQNGTMTTGTFVSQVLGPIQLAIWQVMGTLPNGKGNDTNSLTRGFVTLAQNEWTNVLSNPANALTQYYNNNVQVFYPTSGVGQSFISMVATPEPGTMVLFGTGALLVGLGCARRRAGRSR